MTMKIWLDESVQSWLVRHIYILILWRTFTQNSLAYDKIWQVTSLIQTWNKFTLIKQNFPINATNVISFDPKKTNSISIWENDGSKKIRNFFQNVKKNLEIHHIFKVAV